MHPASVIATAACTSMYV